MADNTPTPDFTGLRYIPIDTSVPDWDSSKNQPNPKDIPSSEPLQLKPSTNKTLPSAVQPLPTPKDVYDTTVEGGKQLIQGTQELGQGPSSGSGTAEAIHDVISGGIKAGTVPMMFAAAVDPMLTLEGAAESQGGQYVGEKGATALGASPETAQAVGDVASLAVPSVMHMIPPRPEGSAFLPNKEAGQVDFSGLRVVPENNIIYRARPEGQEGIKVTEGSHAHATANEAEANQYAQNLNKMAEDRGEDTKHVVDKIDLNKVPYGDYDVMKGPNGHDWIKFKTDQPEDIFKKSDKAPAAEQNSPIKISTEDTQSSKKYDLTPGIHTIKTGDASIVYQISDEPNHPIDISSVRVPQVKRGRGAAKAALQEFVDMADKTGRDLRLVASPLDKKTSTSRLVDLYQQFGFKKTGESANPVGDPWMERSANSATATPDGESYYHITPTENVPKIIKEGLKPQKGERSSKLEKDTGTYLFKSKTDAQDALSNWLGDEFDEDQPLSLLKVNPPKGTVIPGSAGYEHIAKGHIDAKHIQHLGDADTILSDIPEPEKSPIKISTDNNGIKWAENSDGVKVSVPKRIPESEIDSYAREQLDSQAKGQAALKEKIKSDATKGLEK